MEWSNCKGLPRQPFWWPSKVLKLLSLTALASGASVPRCCSKKPRNGAWVCQGEELWRTTWPLLQCDQGCIQTPSTSPSRPVRSASICHRTPSVEQVLLLSHLLAQWTRKGFGIDSAWTRVGYLLYSSNMYCINLSHMVMFWSWESAWICHVRCRVTTFEIEWVKLRASN